MSHSISKLIVRLMTMMMITLLAFLLSNISERVLLFQIGREILDKNFKIRGFQQKSELRVVPLTDM